MKIQLTALASAVGIAMAASGSSAFASPTDKFVSADRDQEAVAGCIVGTAFSSLGISECFCHTSDWWSFCGVDDGNVAGGGGVVGAFGEALSLEPTKLWTNVKTFAPYDDIQIDVSASCTLQNELDILNINAPTEEFEGLLGQVASYTAIYMWPEVDGHPVADPVRLCARGMKAELAQASFETQDDLQFTFEATDTDFGMAGGFSWVAKDLPSSWRGHNVKAKFMVVAAVEDSLLQAFSNDVVAVGVVAKAKLKDRALHAEAKNY
jgi:hypothetical protein